MEQRPKLELEINKETHIRLQSEPKVGESQYGKYWLFTVSNGSNKEYSFFCPNEDVYEKLKGHGKGTEAIITKLAAQRGKKLVTTYDVQIVEDSEKMSEKDNAIDSQTNPYLESMLQSFADAIKVQDKFNGMANVNQLAVTMFIQRTKNNHQFN
jgi:hypothetical protein